MYVYYRNTHNKFGEWRPVALKEVKNVDDALHMTPLAVDTLHTDHETYEGAKYTGDFVLDLDYKPVNDTPEAYDDAIQLAIDSTRRILEWVKGKCDPHHVRWYLSGKKGFHIHVPHQHWMERNKLVKRLPSIYKVMAQEIGGETDVEGIDMGLYSSKRGHMIRVANKAREDGNYKVPISVEVLETLTPQQYKELVTHPRPEIALPRIPLSMPWKTFFDRCFGLSEDASKFQNQRGLPDDVLDGFGVEEHPECIKRLIFGKHEIGKGTFHKQALQLGIYLQRVGAAGSAEGMKLIDTMAKFTRSSNYATDHARAEHIKYQVLPFVKDPKYQFACGPIRACVDTKDACKACPVQRKVAEDVSETTGISKLEDGYYYTNDDGLQKRLTNFHIEVVDLFIPPEHEGKMTDAWDGGKFAIVVGERSVDVVTVSRDAFASFKNFDEAFNRYRESSLQMTDHEVRRLKEFVLMTNNGVKGMKTVYTVGVHRLNYTPEDADEPTIGHFWIEKGWSISGTGMTVGIKLEKKVDNVIKHEHRKLNNDMSAEQCEAFIQLTKSIDPHSAGLILGWVGAAQVKELVLHRTREFPLLNITGIAGSGKTSIAKLFTAIGSADYRESPKTVENMSAWPMRQLVSESTSVPRIFDEANKPRVSYLKWNVLREVLKACYQGSTISVGAIKAKRSSHDNRNIESINTKACAPVIYLSTSPADEAELMERSIGVKLQKSTHKNPQHSVPFKALNNSPKKIEVLFEIGKILALSAIRCDEEILYTQYEAWLAKMPEDFEERTKKSLAYVFWGMEFIKGALTKAYCTEAVIESIDALMDKTMEWVLTNQHTLGVLRTRTEIDNYFDRIAIAASDVDQSNNPRLRPHIHYLRRGNVLYLNMVPCYIIYRWASTACGTRPEFSTPKQVTDAMSQHASFLGEENLQNNQGIFMRWHKFDISSLEARSVDFSRLYETQ